MLSRHLAVACAGTAQADGGVRAEDQDGDAGVGGDRNSLEASALCIVAELTGCTDAGVTGGTADTSSELNLKPRVSSCVRVTAIGTHSTPRSMRPARSFTNSMASKHTLALVSQGTDGPETKCAI